MTDKPRVSHDPAAHQFVIGTEAGKAVLEYALQGNRMEMTHTVVPKAVEGRGLGSALATAALEHARKEQMAVVPTCPFVRRFIESHPEYAPLVAHD